jgi:F-type H+-transporting ATPase subunit b
MMAVDIQQLIILAQEEEPTGLDLVLPEPAELIGGALAFIVVFFVLSRVAFPKIRAAVEKRESEVQGNLERAENAKGEAEKVLEDYKRQLAEARSEANRIIEEARGQAEQVRKDLIAKAEKDAGTIVARAQEQIEAERTRAVQELQGQIASFSIELAEKVVGRSLDGETHRDLVDAYIKEVSGMSTNGGSSS